jgi:hypothetical protein
MIRHTHSANIANLPGRRAAPQVSRAMFFGFAAISQHHASGDTDARGNSKAATRASSAAS